MGHILDTGISYFWALRLGTSTAAQNRQVCKVGVLLPQPSKTSVLSWGALINYDDESTILMLLPGAVQRLKLPPRVNTFSML